MNKIEAIKKYETEHTRLQEQQRITWEALREALTASIPIAERIELAQVASKLHWENSPNSPYPNWDDGYDPIVSDEYMANNRLHEVIKYLHTKQPIHPILKKYSLTIRHWNAQCKTVLGWGIIQEANHE